MSGERAFYIQQAGGVVRGDGWRKSWRKGEEEEEEEKYIYKEKMDINCVFLRTEHLRYEMKERIK